MGRSPTKDAKDHFIVSYFVQKQLENICKQFPLFVIYHHKDDTLLADSDADTFKMFDEVKRILPCWGLQISP